MSDSKLIEATLVTGEHRLTITPTDPDGCDLAIDYADHPDVAPIVIKLDRQTAQTLSQLVFDYSRQIEMCDFVMSGGMPDGYAVPGELLRCQRGLHDFRTPHAGFTGYGRRWSYQPNPEDPNDGMMWLESTAVGTPQTAADHGFTIPNPIESSPATA